MQALFGGLSQAASQITQSPLRIDIVLSDAATRQQVPWPLHPTSGGGGGGGSSAGGPGSAAPAGAPPGTSHAFVFSSGERISGELRLSVAGGKRLEHAGLKLELKGVLDVASEKAPHEFAAQVLELSGPGALAGVTSVPFTFARAAAPVESYVGANARVAYLLRAVVTTRGTFAAAGALSREVELVARNASAAPPPPEGVGGGAGVGGAAVAAGADPDSPVKLEVGIEDCLHIEFEYSRTRYHLGDVVTGRIEFMELGIKLKRMEVAVVRKETTGLGASRLI
jgi:vacuolar protein sorting-associated protein 26